MNILDKLKDSYSFLGDPLHKEAWERIEELENAIRETLDPDGITGTKAWVEKMRRLLGDKTDEK